MKRAILLFGLALLLSASGFSQLDTSKWYALNDNFNGYTCAAGSQNTVSAGILTQTILYGSYPCTSGPSNQYKAGFIVPAHFSFLYGTVKASFKPCTYGGHCNVWAWGGASGSAGYPPTCLAAMKASGTIMAGCTNSTTDSWEVDIAEHKPGSTGLNYIWNNVIQWHNGAFSSNDSGSTNLGVNLSAAFHNYEWDWTPAGHTFKADGTTTRTSTMTVNVPMFLIIDQETDSAAGSGTYPVTSQTQSIQVICTTSTVYYMDGVQQPTCTPGAVIFNDFGTVATVNVASTGTARQGFAMQGEAVQ